MATNLKKRLVSGFLLIIIVGLAVWFDEPIPWLTLGAAIWCCLALVEFYRLVEKKDSKIKPLTVFGIIWATAFIVSPHFSAASWYPALITTGIVFSLIWLVFRKDKESSFTSWAWTITGVLYVGLLLSHLVALRLLPDGAGWAFMAIFTVVVSDSAAFFIGSAFGKRRIAPSISPQKTLAGSFGGLAGGGLASPLLVYFFELPVGWLEAILLGLVVSFFSQVGDLAESLFKRNVNTKDSGKLVPGHGGCLDRMDSIVFGAVVVYYYVLWIV